MQTSNSPTVSPSAEDEEIKKGLTGKPCEREEAFERAYRRYARPLAAFIRESVAPTLDSDEIATAVSEAFCGLARYIDRGKFRSDGALSTILFSIARLKAYDQLRAKSCLKRRSKDCELDDEVEDELSDLSDDEFATRVTQRLIKAPQIRDSWRTAADTGAANEIIRQFRLWIGGLPRLQRKVSQTMLTHFGDVSDKEISDEIAAGGNARPSEASVRSARKEITRKFKTLIQTQERIIKS